MAGVRHERRTQSALIMTVFQIFHIYLQLSAPFEQHRRTVSITGFARDGHIVPAPRGLKQAVALGIDLVTNSLPSLRSRWQEESPSLQTIVLGESPQFATHEP